MVDAVADGRQIGFQTGSFIKWRLKNLSGRDVFRVKRWHNAGAGPGRDIGKNLVVVVEIGLDCDANLSKIAHILGHFPSLQHAGVDRIGDRNQDGDDRHDHKQLEECEGARKIAMWNH